MSVSVREPAVPCPSSALPRERMAHTTNERLFGGIGEERHA
ncbi:hypothetical protein [Streptomyces sp. AK02-01A]|nr:hypothetical protein [Streptomyces sp. AK02-01A]MDX3849209.1 hypothetical protein [Streptomyces sp. AK02-01A]